MASMSQTWSLLKSFSPLRLFVWILGIEVKFLGFHGKLLSAISPAKDRTLNVKHDLKAVTVAEHYFQVTSKNKHRSPFYSERK